MDEFKKWLASPFQADMDALHWALFILLLILILTGWGLIFRHLRGIE